jgi:hypothetical protein
MVKTGLWLNLICAVGILLAAFYLIPGIMGFDPMTPGYGNESLVAIVAVGLGGGAGLQLARRWRRALKQKGK